jgi:hypothetical protein
MLIVCTLPPTLFPGTYRVAQIDQQTAARFLREAAEDDSLCCCVHFGSTAKVLRKISGLSERFIFYEQRPMVPPPQDGDSFLLVRLATGVSARDHRDMGPNDFAFFFGGVRCQNQMTAQSLVSRSASLISRGS